MRDLCLFAHFDKNDIVDDYVLHYLRHIRQLGFSTILISSAQLTVSGIARAKIDCQDVIVRENAGLDFASWSAGFAKYRHEFTGRLLLVNDSVYGPIGDLANAFDRLGRTPADFYGMVESLEATPHLQSWFLLFEPWVVKTKEFAAILDQPFNKMTKTQIIRNGELALSQRLVAAGFRYEALFRNDRSQLMNQRHFANPMLLFWRELLLVDRVPFLKIELLRDNPLGVEDSDTIMKAATQIDPQFGKLIKQHLTRIAIRKPSLQRPFLARRKYALIRQRYYMQQGHRPIAWAWNSVQLASISAVLNRWCTVRDRFRRSST